jgi:protein ImuB
MFAVLYLSEFALQAVRRLEDDGAGGAEGKRGHGGARDLPVALLAAGARAVVAECNPAARAAGVEPGLTVPQALARCDRLVVRAPQAAAESEARAMLLAAAFSVSPAVEATAGGVCTIQIDGLSADHRVSAVEAAVERLAAGGLRAAAGIASTALLALYAARVADHNPSPRVLAVPAGAGRSFLAPLPLAAADPPPALAAIAAGWGIRTLGDFAALAKADVTNRLGAEGLALWERCAGGADRPLRRVAPDTAFVAQWDCEHELETVEPLLFILRRLVDRLSLELNNAGLAAGTLELVLTLSDETAHTHSIRLPQPSTQADILYRALGTYLDSLRTSASISAVRLAMEPTRIALRQEGLFDCALRDPHGFTETLARAAALVGTDRVGTPAVEPTHRPDAVRLKAPAELLPPLVPRFELPPQGLALRRYRPPVPATVELSGRFPAYLWTPAVHGTVLDRAGPWHSSGDWWQPDRRWEREEWDIELEPGGLYRLARTPAGWFLEGEYD